MSHLRRRWIIFASALLAVILAGVGFFRWQNRISQAQVAASPGSPPVKPAVPAVDKLRDDVKRALAEEKIVADKTLKSLLTRIAKSLDGPGGTREVKALLGSWELPHRMKAHAAMWRSAPREWTRLAGELEAAAHLDVEGEPSLIAQLQTVMAAQGAAGELDSRWGEITLVLKDLAATNNRLLPDFTPWAANEIRSATRLADGTGRAQAAAEKLREILTFVRDMGPRVVWARFEKQAPGLLQTPGSELMAGWPDKWKQEAEKFVVPTDEKRAEWSRFLASAEVRIAKLTAKDQPAHQQKLAAARSACAEAAQPDVAAIDGLLAEFKALRLPIEEAHGRFTAFLTPWKAEAASTVTVQDAQRVLAKFQAETGKLLPAYQSAIHSRELVRQMSEALETPDKISLLFSRPEGWTFVVSDSGAAIYKYRGTVSMPFLVLGKTGYAMSAIETPLSLARLVGVVGSPPGSGPKIRTADFSPEVQWLWKGPLDFMGIHGLAAYFAPGVSPGDIGSDMCPATWLSFAEAKAMAAKLGGQLPTAEQWLAAADRAGAVRRLRSKAWTAQANQVLQWSNIHSLPTRAFLPSAGSFSLQPGLSANYAHLSDTTVAPNATDDHAVWLKSVLPSGGWKPADQFYHLIGNAAEWVDDKGTPAVIGGSVVSPPSLPVNAPLPIRNGAGAFFDVTFRLVVKLGEGGAGVGLAKFKKAAAAIPMPAAPAAQ